MQNNNKTTVRIYLKSGLIKDVELTNEDLELLVTNTLVQYTSIHSRLNTDSESTTHSKPMFKYTFIRLQNLILPIDSLELIEVL
jgi:hypothetical protein